MSNPFNNGTIVGNAARAPKLFELSLIHISEPTRLL